MVRKTLKLSILVLSFSALSSLDNNLSPIISTNFGKIQGLKNLSKKEHFTLLKSAQEVSRWDDVFQATNLVTCPHINTTEENEDCLKINVYVPKECFDKQNNLDVIVHIHGGGFMTGSGHMYGGPEYVMDRDLVFVTFNYRLGILGFLSSQDDIIPGNNGLKDQVLALKWVQKNIAHFHGNPQSVTLTGVSAGGMSVHYHYLSRQSKGLFHRGFSQSGVALNPQALQKEPLEKYTRLARLLNCPTNSSKEMLACLKKKTVQEILRTTTEFTELGLPIVPFGPVVENANENEFLTQHPFKILKSGDVYDVPWLSSNTANECVLLSYQSADKMGVLNNENWEKYAPYILDFNYTVPINLWKHKAELIKNFYVGASDDIGGHFEKLVKIATDRLHLTGGENAIKLHLKAVKSPVYYYYFNYQGEHSYSQWYTPNHENIHGIGHMDDTLYFYTGVSIAPLTNSRDIKMKDTFLDMLTSFASTGVPRTDTLMWQQVKKTPGPIQYMNITSPDNIEIREISEFAPIEFWSRLGFKENENL